jgi:hypothetical protein
MGETVYYVMGHALAYDSYVTWIVRQCASLVESKDLAAELNSKILTQDDDELDLVDYPDGYMLCKKELDQLERVEPKALLPEFVDKQECDWYLADYFVTDTPVAAYCLDGNAPIPGMPGSLVYLTTDPENQNRPL